MPVRTILSNQLKGNLNTKFGVKLPVPFIEGVKIREETITLKASLYLPLDEYTNKNFDVFYFSKNIFPRCISDFKIGKLPLYSVFASLICVLAANFFDYYNSREL